MDDDRSGLAPDTSDVGAIARTILQTGDLVALRALFDRLEEAGDAVRRRHLLGLVADLAADARELTIRLKP